MKLRFLFSLVVILGGICSANAQGPGQPASPNAAFYPTDPMGGILIELQRISSSVNSLTKQMANFVDKFEKVGGATFTEKQQRLVLGMELLSRAEARVGVLQKSQIELTEKLNETRGKLTQVEIDLRPPKINNSVAFEGTTQTEEIRDARTRKLQAERVSLTQLQRQIESNLLETNKALQDAILLAERLRKQYLPQIERELYDQ